MLNNVMPQRGVFFNLLVAHTDRLVAAANATLRLISGLGNPQFDTTPLIDEVNLNETSADDLKDQLIRLLYQSFTTPINRDQIHTLTMDLDRVVDSIQSVANSIATHHIEVSTPAAREMASLSADACIRLHRAVVALEGRERVQEIVKQCEEVEQIESRAAEVMRQAISTVNTPSEMLSRMAAVGSSIFGMASVLFFMALCAPFIPRLRSSMQAGRSQWPRHKRETPV